MNVRRVIIIEGAVNLIVMGIKLFVGLLTQSTAILADALHSLTDFSNNIIVWLAVKRSEEAPDADHNYGHQKFIPLAIFFLATLLCVIAIEVVTHAISRFNEPVLNSGLGLSLMLFVLGLNVLLSIWQQYWAKRLDSSILNADASHTFSDALTSVAVIAGWQLASQGLYWLDTVFAFIVAGIIFSLAYKLFLKSIPILVDKNSHDQERIRSKIYALPEVAKVAQVRSRSDGQTSFADITVKLVENMSLSQAHETASKIELILKTDFNISDTTVHVEPPISDDIT